LLSCYVVCEIYEGLPVSLEVGADGWPCFSSSNSLPRINHQYTPLSRDILSRQQHRHPYLSAPRRQCERAEWEQGCTSPITLTSKEILLMHHRECQEPSETKDICSRKRMHQPPPPNKPNHHRPKKNMRQHQIHPEIKMRKSHDNPIIPKQKYQQNTHPNSAIILLLLIPYPH
jgi:hypothetical protein